MHRCVYIVTVCVCLYGYVITCGDILYVGAQINTVYVTTCSSHALHIAVYYSRETQACTGCGNKLSLGRKKMTYLFNQLDRNGYSSYKIYLNVYSDSKKISEF